MSSPGRLTGRKQLAFQTWPCHHIDAFKGDGWLESTQFLLMRPGTYHNAPAVRQPTCTGRQT